MRSKYKKVSKRYYYHNSTTGTKRIMYVKDIQLHFGICQHGINARTLKIGEIYRWGVGQFIKRLK